MPSPLADGSGCSGNMERRPRGCPEALSDCHEAAGYDPQGPTVCFDMSSSSITCPPSTQERLERLVMATSALITEVSLEGVFQRVQVAAEVIGARYAAIGVVGPDGGSPGELQLPTGSTLSLRAATRATFYATAEAHPAHPFETLEGPRQPSGAQ